MNPFKTSHSGTSAGPVMKIKINDGLVKLVTGQHAFIPQPADEYVSHQELRMTLPYKVGWVK